MRNVAHKIKHILFQLTFILFKVCKNVFMVLVLINNNNPE